MDSITTTNTPTDDELFGPEIPTDDELFGPEPINGPISGSFADHVFDTIKPIRNVAAAFGTAFSAAYGDEPSEAEKASEQWLRKTGIFNDYSKHEETLRRTLNEAVIRPLILNSLDIGVRGLGGLLAAGAEATGQAGYELSKFSREAANDPNNPLGVFSPGALIAGATGELLKGAASGAGMEFAIPMQARASGIIGEGERGFFNTKEISPVELQQRAEAAKQGGLLETPPVKPPVTDVHEVARQVAPDAFNEFDTLKARADEIKRTIKEYKKTELENTPELVDKTAKLMDPETYTKYEKLNEVKENLNTSLDYLHSTKLRELEREIFSLEAKGGKDLQNLGVNERSRLLSFQESLLQLKLKQLETPEIISTRQRIVDNDLALRDMIEPLGDLRRRAQEALEAPDAEGKMFRDMVRRKTEIEPLHNELIDLNYKLNDLIPKVKAAYDHADSLIPEAERAKVVSTTEAPITVPTKHIEGVISGTPETIVSHDDALTVSSEGTLKAEQAEGVLRNIEGTGPTRTHGVASTVEARAIEKGLIEDLGDLPEYKQADFKEQAVKAIELVTKDYGAALEMMAGNKATPKDILPGAILRVLTEEATIRGDLDAIRTLANSSFLNERYTAMGREIGILGYMDRTGPVEVIKNVENARRKAAEKSRPLEESKGEIIKELKEVIKKVPTPSKATWETFIKSIECDY